MDNTFEFVDSRPVRDISFSGKACTDNEVLGFSGSAIRSLDSPAPFIGVELAFRDDCSKGSPFSEV